MTDTSRMIDGNTCKLSLRSGIMIALLMATIGLGFYKHAATSVPVQVTTYQLRALRGIDSVRGSVFLGSGSIGYQHYYFYYYQVGNGAYRSNSLDDDGNILVYEEPRRDAIMVETYYGWGGPKSWQVEYEFHVPVGTIAQDYHL